MKQFLLVCFLLFPVMLSFAANDPYLFERGQQCWKTGRFDAAIGYFQNYRKRNQFSPEEAAKALFWSGKCFYYKWEIEKAVSCFQEVVSLYPNTIHAPISSKWIADSYFNSRDYQRAILQYRVFLTAFPSHEAVPLAVFFLGNSYAKLGQYSEAASCYQRVIAVYPTHSIVRQCQFQLGVVRKKMN